MFRNFIFKFLILTVFVFSGGAGLIYQVTWQRALTLYYGVGSVSTSIVVSVFLLGLGIGALLGGWIAEKTKWRLWVYLLVEVAIGVIGLVSADVIVEAGKVLSGSSLGAGFFILAIMLLIPTILMGVTLPLVVKILNSIDNNAGKSISLLYFVNTIGAALGSFIAAYYLISFYGIKHAINVAAYVNFALAGLLLLAGLIMGKRAFSSGENHGSEPDGVAIMPVGPDRFTKPWMNYGAVFATGFLAVGYQIVWFRLLAVLLKQSTYVFPTVLGVYLAGIAIGSYYVHLRMNSYHRKNNHKQVFFRINFGIAVLSLLTIAVFYWGVKTGGPVNWMASTTFDQHLHPPYHPMYAIKGDTPAELWKSKYLFGDVLLWPFLFVFPMTLLMGASFPLATSIAIGNSREEGWRTGAVYFSNIVGNVLGALITGFILSPILGSELILMLFTILGGFWLLGTKRVSALKPVMKWVAVGAFAVITIIAMPHKGDLMRTMHATGTYGEVIVTENVDGVVVTSNTAKSGREGASIFINGSAHARFPAAAYRVEVLEAITRADSVKDVLVIGFGGGDLTNTVLMTEGVESVTVVEISHALIDNLKQISFYGRIFDDPRMNLVVEDGRRFLHTTDKTFDLVLMDPLRSTTAYSNNIYSEEFFALVKTRLKPKGVLMTWMNEYSIIPKTLTVTFDYMHCFYYFCLSSQEEMVPNEARRAALWALQSETMRKGMLRRMDLNHYFKGDRDKIVELTKNVKTNTDFTPNTEYYIGYNLKRYWRWKD